MNQRKLRVLAADDDPTMAILLRAVLQAPEFELVVVANGADALRAASGGEAFDIALLDVEMPEVDGLLVAATLRRQFGDRLSIVLLTGREDAAFVAAQQRLQAQHLPKPVDWTQLPQRLRRWVALA